MMFYGALIFLIILFIAVGIYYLPLRLEVEYKNVEKNNSLNLRLKIISGILIYKTKLSIFDIEKLLKPEIAFFDEVETVLDTDLSKQREKIYRPQVFLKKAYSLLSKNLSFLESFILLKKIIRKNKEIFKKVHCEKFEWTTEIGLSDPVMTGLATALLWNLKTFIYFKIYKYLVIDTPNPKLDITPSFSQEKIDFQLNCIFRAKMGDIIIKTISLFFLVVTFRLREGGKLI